MIIKKKKFNMKFCATGIFEEKGAEKNMNKKPNFFLSLRYVFHQFFFLFYFFYFIFYFFNESPPIRLPLRKLLHNTPPLSNRPKNGGNRVVLKRVAGKAPPPPALHQTQS